MKLALFTPLPPAHTEIGNVSARLIPMLAEHFELTIFSETVKYDPALNKCARIIPFTCDTLDWKAVHLAGTPLYQIGNNFHFHSEIIKAARLNPGIVVLHDLCLHETLLNIALYKGKGRAEYFSMMLRYGGQKGTDLARKLIDLEDSKKHALATEYPLFEAVVENAIGVITHNPANIAHIHTATHAPLQYAPLPYLSSTQIAPPITRSPKPKGQPYDILIFGFLGSDNRRLVPFLEALQASGVTEAYRVTIAGKYDEKLIKQKVRELGLRKKVSFRGFVSDAELDSLLKNSDLVPNFRWPSRGESSATQLRIWNFSLPSLVTHTAYYATLPNEAVSFVDPRNEKEDIIRHLVKFADDPVPYFAKGQYGRSILIREHAIEAFIHRLKTFLPSAAEFAGKIFPLTWSNRLAGSHLDTYPDPEIRKYLKQRCAGEISNWVTQT